MKIRPVCYEEFPRQKKRIMPLQVESSKKSIDPRGLLCLGFWKRSIPKNFEDFLKVQNKDQKDALLRDEKQRYFPFQSFNSNRRLQQISTKASEINSLKEEASEFFEKQGFTYKLPFRYSDRPAVDDLDEPHFKRRLAILEKYPSIVQLFGTENSSKYIFLACLVIQLGMLTLFSPFGLLCESPVWLMVLLSYLIGATITQMNAVLLHEATHNLIFPGGNIPNIAFGFALNTLIVFPVGYAFRRYHLLHHQFQGVVGMDPDLPFNVEYILIKGNIISKALWIVLYPLLYLLRSLALKMAPTSLEILNWLQTTIWNFGLYKFFGPFSFAYFTLSTYFGLSFHIAAAHFIQEHYTWTSGQETYSYYGSLNKLFLNIGFHNEHHDFTKANIDLTIYDKIPISIF